LIKFKIPEALTKWKFLSFAHTKDLKYGFLTKELVTKKNLMVITNPLDFLEKTILLFLLQIIQILIRKKPIWNWGKRLVYYQAYYRIGRLPMEPN